MVVAMKLLHLRHARQTRKTKLFRFFFQSHVLAARYLQQSPRAALVDNDYDPAGGTRTASVAGHAGADKPGWKRARPQRTYRYCNVFALPGLSEGFVGVAKMNRVVMRV